MICHVVSRPASPGEKHRAGERGEREHAPEPDAVTGRVVGGGAVLPDGDRQHHVVGVYLVGLGRSVETDDASRHATATARSAHLTPGVRGRPGLAFIAA